MAHQDLLKNVNLHVTRDSLGVAEDLSVALEIYHWSNLTVQLKKSWPFLMVSSVFSLFTQYAILPPFSFPFRNQIQWY